MLPRPSENPENYYQKPLEVRPDLQEEYGEGVKGLIGRLRKKGFDPIFVLAFGSLTREKELKQHETKEGTLESDADFIVITKNKPLSMLLSEAAQIGRGEEHGEVKEKPFTEHIPNFDVKIWTPKYCIDQLRKAVEFYESYEFDGKEVNDIIDDARVNNKKRGLVSILTFGIRVDNPDKDDESLLPIREMLKRAQKAVEKYDSLYHQYVPNR